MSFPMAGMDMKDAATHLAIKTLQPVLFRVIFKLASAQYKGQRCTEARAIFTFISSTHPARIRYTVHGDGP